MSVVMVAVVGAVLLVAIGLYFKVFAGWRRIHQGILGSLTLFYGMWLALFTGSVLKLVVPGVGSVVLGSAAGAGVGVLTYFAVGVVGVVTGGAGIALGALGMVCIGALVGGLGGAAGGAFARVPLISPWFWAPVLLVGAYLLAGSLRRGSRLTAVPAKVGLPPPDAQPFARGDSHRLGTWPMSPRYVQLLMYLAGVLVLGLFYGQVKEMTGGGMLFVALAIAYLIIVRLLGLFVARRLSRVRVSS